MAAAQPRGRGESRTSGGWLTTVVARVCLDMLRARSSRREEPLQPDGRVARRTRADPEREALLAESVGMALLVVLETLAPAERVAFVLHDLFAIRSRRSPRSWALAGRRPPARQPRPAAGQGASEPADAGPTCASGMVDAFLSAARAATSSATVAARSRVGAAADDTAAVAMGVAPELRGAAAVAGPVLRGARRSERRSSTARRAWCGLPARVPAGDLPVHGSATAQSGRVSELAADPERLSRVGG